MNKYNISEKDAQKIFPLPDSWSIDDLKFEMNNYFSDSLRKTLHEVNGNLGQLISVVHPICESPLGLGGFGAGIPGHPNLFKAPVVKAISVFNYMRMSKINFGITEEQISEFEETIAHIQDDINKFDTVDWKALKDVVETDNWKLCDIPRGLVCGYLNSNSLDCSSSLYWPIKYCNKVLEIMTLEELEKTWAFTYPYINTDKATFVEVTPMNILIPELKNLKDESAPRMPASLLPLPGFNPNRYNMFACMLDAINDLKKDIVDTANFHMRANNV